MCSSQVWNNITDDETAIFESHRKFATRVYVNKHSGIRKQIFSAIQMQYKPRRFSGYGTLISLSL